MRCFIAIPLPPEISGKLAGEAEKLREYAKIKPVNPGNIHLTLKFLGETGEGKACEVVEILGKTAFKPFRISVSGLGAFPKPSRPRVIWAGVGEGADEIKRIQEELESEAVRLGFNPGKRFHPHYTIARVKSVIDGTGIRQMLGEKHGEEYGSCVCGKIQLIQSNLTPDGPVYNEIASQKAV